MTKKNKKGFTLTELIVVIVIIGILAAVLIPSITGYVKKAKESAAIQEATVALDVYEVFKAEKEELPVEQQTFKQYYKVITGDDLAQATCYEKDDHSTFVFKASNNRYVEIKFADKETKVFETKEEIDADFDTNYTDLAPAA